MEDFRSRQLRPRTMISYEQTLKLFSIWIEDQEGIFQVEDIKEKHIREYIIYLQSRGKYTHCASDDEKNDPKNRRDYQLQVSNITINHYLRNLRAFFTWIVDMASIPATPLRRIKPLHAHRACRGSNRAACVQAHRG